MPVHSNELLRRSAVMSCIFTAVFLLTPTLHIIALQMSALSILLIIADLVQSQTYIPAVHWRTVIPFFLNFLVFVILVLEVTGVSARNYVLHLIKSVIFGLCLLVTSSISLVILLFAPVPTLPPLSGKHRVGTSTFTLPVTLPPSSQIYKDRQLYPLTVQAWYPLSSSSPPTLFFSSLPFLGRKLATLWTSGDPDLQTEESLALLTACAQSSSIRPSLLKHLALATSNAEYHKIPEGFILSRQQPEGHPVLLYSHGMHSWRQISSCVFEEMASRGFVVLSCDHCPSAMLTRHHVSESNSDGSSNGQPRMEKFDYSVPSGIVASTCEEQEFYRRGLDVRVHEVITLLDYLKTDEARQKFHTQGEKFHLMGHSFGAGTIAALTARARDRVASCVFLDSWMYPLRASDLTPSHPLPPVLFISSELWSALPYQAACRHELLRGEAEGGARSVVFKGSAHTMYCDLHLLGSPPLLRLAGMVGEDIDVPLFVEALNKLVTRFFAAADANGIIGVDNDAAHDATAPNSGLASDGSTGDVAASVGVDSISTNIESSGFVAKRESCHPHRDAILNQFFDIRGSTGDIKRDGCGSSIAAPLLDSSTTNIDERKIIIRGGNRVQKTHGFTDKSQDNRLDQDSSVLTCFLKSCLVDESTLPHGGSRLADFAFTPLEHTQNEV